MIHSFEVAGRTLTLSLRIYTRTIGAKYRKSFLGYFWMVAPTLLITAGGGRDQGLVELRKNDRLTRKIHARDVTARACANVG